MSKQPENARSSLEGREGGRDSPKMCRGAHRLSQTLSGRRVSSGRPITTINARSSADAAPMKTAKPMRTLGKCAAATAAHTMKKSAATSRSIKTPLYRYRGGLSSCCSIESAADRPPPVVRVSPRPPAASSSSKSSGARRLPAVAAAAAMRSVNDRFARHRFARRRLTCCTAAAIIGPIEAQRVELAQLMMRRNRVARLDARRRARFGALLVVLRRLSEMVAIFALNRRFLEFERPSIQRVLVGPEAARPLALARVQDRKQSRRKFRSSPLLPPTCARRASKSRLSVSKRVSEPALW